MLAKLGYRVITARNGAQALDRYREHMGRIGLVILDMIMPEVSGRQTFEQLKALDGQVKVLLSSGYSMNGEAAAILAAGCAGFLQKPFALEELSDKLRELLPGDRGA
jgi:CheY-like chemotaxis protein